MDIELLRELQGERTQQELAAMLGISQPLLSMVLSGQRSVGKTMLAGLIKLFPDRSEELLRVFGVLDHSNSQDAITEEDKVTE